MESAPTSSGIPPSIDRVLRLFRSMGREEKMQALVQYSKKLEPLPEAGESATTAVETLARLADPGLVASAGARPTPTSTNLPPRFYAATHRDRVLTAGRTRTIHYVATRGTLEPP